MQATNEFTGLTMPTFAAFGWAGEENALKYALSQLELFIGALHARLSPAARSELPTFGLSRENQNVYLASGSDQEQEAFIVFNARPMSFEVQLGVVNKTVLAKGLAQINKDPIAAHHILTQLDPEWTLRVQQMQVDEDTQERAHHQDLYKDSVSNFSEDRAREVFSKAAFLNEEDRWVTPVYLSYRMPSERVSVMGLAVLDITADLVNTLLPVISLLTGRKPRKAKQAKSSAAAKPKTAKAFEPERQAESPGEGVITATTLADAAQGFSYTAELMPLHIRRGFINLTPGHWPFFAASARSETRDVTVVFGGRQDRNSSVWRLQPNEQARLVLGPQVHEWLEEHFSSSDKIRVTARKLEDDEIRVTLEAVE